MNIDFTVAFLKRNGLWVAQAYEKDICVQASTLATARKIFVETAVGDIVLKGIIPHTPESVLRMIDTWKHHENINIKYKYDMEKRVYVIDF